MSRIMAVSALLFTTSMIQGCSSALDPSRADRGFDAGGLVTYRNQVNQIKHRFSLENDTSSDLIVNEIVKSCTCASATISKQRLAPGETADLEMVINARPIFNSWNVSCRVLTNHPTEPERDYLISYRTYPHVRFDVDTIRIGGDGAAPGSAGEAETGPGAWIEIYEPAGSEPDALLDVQVGGPIRATVESEPIVDLIEGGQSDDPDIASRWPSHRIPGSPPERIRRRSRPGRNAVMRPRPSPCGRWNRPSSWRP